MNSNGLGQSQSQHGGADASTDLTTFVQNLPLQMQTRFQTMSESIITKIDVTGTRIDELERSIGDLTKESGVADATPTTPSYSSFPELRGGSSKEVVVEIENVASKRLTPQNGHYYQRWSSGYP